MKYERRQSEVEALQFQDQGMAAAADWPRFAVAMLLNEDEGPKLRRVTHRKEGGHSYKLVTSAGERTIQAGQWLVYDAERGAARVVADDDFQAEYQAADSGEAVAMPRFLGEAGGARA